METLVETLVACIAVLDLSVFSVAGQEEPYQLDHSMTDLCLIGDPQIWGQVGYALDVMSAAEACFINAIGNTVPGLV